MPEETKPKKPTLEDPIAPEIIGKFNELEEARYRIATQLLDIEQDRIRLLAAAHQVDEQKQRLFEQVLMERGLPPNSRVVIESNTGTLKLLDEGEKPGKPQ